MDADPALPPLPPVDPSQFEDLSQYRAFWRRTGAILLDGAALLPLAWFDIYLWNSTERPELLIPWLLTYSALNVAYAVWFIARFGQTPGKYACGVKVRAVDGGPATFRHAALRHIVPILFVPVFLTVQVGNVLAGETTGRALGGMAAATVWVALGWLVIELVTMLTNRRRRALHDFIAGTVVIKVSVPASGKALGIGLAILFGANMFVVAPRILDLNAQASVGEMFPGVVEGALANIATEKNQSMPLDVSQFVRLEQVVAEPGMRLSWRFSATSRDTALEVATDFQRTFCADSPHRDLLAQGANYEVVVHDRDGAELVRQQIDRKSCR